jgi:hypothetical protein
VPQIRDALSFDRAALFLLIDNNARENHERTTIDPECASRTRVVISILIRIFGRINVRVDSRSRAARATSRGKKRPAPDFPDAGLDEPPAASPLGGRS